MLKLTGILKKEEAQEFMRKDGTMGKSRMLFIEPEGSIYPVKVNITDPDFKVGKQGETISLMVEIFPYFIQDKQRKRAFVDFYIPSKS